MARYGYQYVTTSSKNVGAVYLDPSTFADANSDKVHTYHCLQCSFEYLGRDADRCPSCGSRDAVTF
jgi:rubrerythrin